MFIGPSSRRQTALQAHAMVQGTFRAKRRSRSRRGTAEAPSAIATTRKVKGALGKASRIHVIAEIFKRQLRKVGEEMGVRILAVSRLRSARNCARRAKTHASKGRYRLNGLRVC